jgi:hypothetical protein
MQRGRRTLVATVAMAMLLLSLGQLPAGAAENGVTRVPVTAGAAHQPAPKPGSVRADQSSPPACTAPAAGKFTCVEIKPAGSAATAARRSSGDVSVQAARAVPTWCTGSLMGTRTEACENFQVTYNTWVTTNGQTTLTGQVQFNAYSYSYSSPDQPAWTHQFSIASYTGWGDATRGSVTGTARGAGDCTRNTSSFPPQPVMPTFTMRSGEATFTTTATAVGAVGWCATTWDVWFTNAGYPPSNPPVTRSLTETRCDNAAGSAGTGFPARIGCVVYWYASAAQYSRTQYPSLASHVSRAQQSGLPGASFAAPLTRTTNQTTINTNRNRACGNPPSITGKSCDEYPLAASNQGLAAGGSLRTFDGCNINAPRATGPTGASACMITASENSAQGGIMTRFNYNWRVLNGDPFRVLISA